MLVLVVKMRMTMMMKRTIVGMREMMTLIL